MIEELQSTKNLVEIIVYHNKRFWIDNNPEISDTEYDLIEEKLKKIDPNNKVFKQINDIKLKHKTKRGKVKHNTPMLSLGKVYTKDNLNKWADNVARSSNERFILQPKLDGVSGDHEEGILSTRGDGFVGENISDKAPLINYIGPKNSSTILELLDLNRRGELIMNKLTFEKNKHKILRTDGSQYKTPRGAVSGLLMRDNVDKSLGRVISFIDFNTYSMCYTLDELKLVDLVELEKELKDWDYGVDGFVIKLEDQEYSHSLGYTSHHPKGQIAFKFANPFAESVLLDIEWSIGKRKITPVGLIKPIILNEAEIKRVSLHNGKFILDNDLHINDIVTVERAGEIIPHIKDSKPGIDRTSIILNNCPNCGTEVVYDEPEIYCPNKECGGTAIKKFYDSCVRIGIENIGEATVKKLLNIGINNLVELFSLRLCDIMLLESFAETSSNNLYNEIQKIKNKSINDWRILSSLNLNGIGTTLSKKLLSKYELFEILIMSEDDLANIDNIGPERARELSEGLYNNEDYLNNLIDIFPEVIDSCHVVVKGKICFTGSGPKKRDFYKKLSEEKGYTSCNSVTKDLTILVTDNPNSTSSKMKKAIKNKTKIVDYEQFMDLI